MAVKPYELYVRFLITKGFESLEDVNKQLTELSLKPITQDEFERQFKTVHDALPKPISNNIAHKRYTEGTFLQWMKVLEVAELWDYEPAFKTPEKAWIKLVYDIGYDPQLRMAIQALLVKGMAHQDICQTLNLKFSYMLRPEHLALYERFFWSPRRMTRGAWREYLKLCDEREKALMFTALTESLDVVKTYLELPATVNISETLQYLLTNSYQKAKHYLRLSTKESNAEARAWIGQVISLADKYEKHRTGDVEDFGKTLQMEFEFIDTEFPTPDEQTLSELRAKQKADQGEGA